MCSRIYIFSLKKKNKTRRQNKTKQTKEGKRISVENLTGYNDTICEFALVLLTYLIESRISLGCSNKFNAVYVEREKLVLFHYSSNCYTATTYKVNTFKNKNKRISL